VLLSNHLGEFLRTVLARQDLIAHEGTIDYTSLPGVAWGRTSSRAG
jgi:hypothetical protein